MTTPQIYLPPEELTAPATPSIPHSREAEEACCGAVLINPECYHEIAQFLQAEDFYIHRHKWIWEAFGRLNAQHIPVDLLTLSEEMDKVGQLAEAGGSAYLTALINQVPSSLNAESYGRIVEAHSIRRKMLAAANQIAALAMAEEKPIQEIQEEAAKSLYEAAHRSNRNGEPLSMSMSRIYDSVDENANRIKRGEPPILGLMTGWIDLDRILMGVEAEFFTVAGQTGTGKTSFLLGLAQHAAMEQGKRVAIFSQEMTIDEIGRRFLAMETGINTQRIKSGRLEENEWPIFTHGVEALSNSTIHVDDTSRMSPSRLLARCMKLANSEGLDLIIVDYLQLLISGGKKENRTQEVSAISRDLKQLTQELKIPVFAASQLNRAYAGRADQKPILSDLRESGSIEQDSNGVIFIHRPPKPEAGKESVTEIIVAKRRDGATDTIELTFRPTIAKFENMYEPAPRYKGKGQPEWMKQQK